MPYPSRGCKTCRIRKVKCDKTRPYCRVCRGVRRLCLGYDVEPGGLVFRHQWTLQRTRRDQLGEKAQPDGSSKPIPDIVYLSSKPSDDPIQPDPFGAPVPKSMPPPLAELALAFYKTHYLDTPNSGFSGIKQHTRAILLKPYACSEPVFTHAVTAESLLLFGKLNHDSRSIVLAHQAYNDALKETTRSLPVLSRACSDPFLVAVMIFSSFETKSDTDSQPAAKAIEATSLQHQVGAMSLLKLRQSHGDTAFADRSIDRSVRQQLLRSYTLRAYPLPDWLSDGAEYGETSDGLYIDRCLVQVCRLRCESRPVLARLRSGCSSQASIRSEILELMNLASWIDQELQNLSDSLAQNHSYKVLPFNELDHTPNTIDFIFNDTLHIYTSLLSSQLWNAYRAARMICNSIIIGLGHFQQFCLGDSRYAFLRSAKTTLGALRDEVCESVSFHLLDIDVLVRHARNDGIDLPKGGVETAVHRAEALVFVLVIATGTANLDPWRKMWIKDKLAKVGKMVGNGTLQMLAASEYSPEGR